MQHATSVLLLSFYKVRNQTLSDSFYVSPLTENAEVAFYILYSANYTRLASPPRVCQSLFSAEMGGGGGGGGGMVWLKQRLSSKQGLVNMFIVELCCVLYTNIFYLD
jgi:hypothetical protein